MERISNDFHFHIYWNQERLDWERFVSRHDAEERAKELVRPNETYSIEEFDNSCEQCQGFGQKMKVTANGL